MWDMYVGDENIISLDYFLINFDIVIISCLFVIWNRKRNKRYSCMSISYCEITFSIYHFSYILADIKTKFFENLFRNIPTFFIFLNRYRIKKFNDLMKLWIDDLCQYNSEEENMTFLCLRTNSFTLTSFRSI